MWILKVKFREIRRPTSICWSVRSYIDIVGPRAYRTHNFEFLNSEYTAKQLLRSHETAAPAKNGQILEGTTVIFQMDEVLKHITDGTPLGTTSVFRKPTRKSLRNPNGSPPKVN